MQQRAIDYPDGTYATVVSDPGGSPQVYTLLRNAAATGAAVQSVRGGDDLGASRAPSPA
ncbi:hypothetical protein [Methylorubrum extorquens]